MSARTESLRPQSRRPRPQLEVVRGKRARTGWRRWVPAAIGVGMLIGGVIVGVLLEQVVLAQSAFKLSTLRTELLRAEARHEELLLEAAKLGSPERIETNARTMLGMVDPPEVRYIVADVHGPQPSRAPRAPDRPLSTDPGVAAAIGDGP